MDCLLIAQSTFSWASPQTWWAIAQVCIGLGFVIFVHELGHFLVAKACGVKCEKFYVGFDFFDIKIGDLVLVPRSLVKFQWGETEYGIGILPLGGYVKMLGQDDNPGNMEKEIERSRSQDSVDGDAQYESVGTVDRDQMDPRSFLAKSVPQRMAIISAGVIFNIFFAIVFAAIAFKSGVNYPPPVIGDVTPGGPAWEANLYGAELTKIGDSKIEGYYQYSDIVQQIALSPPGKPIALEYRLANSPEIKTASVMPRKGVHAAADIPMLGFAAGVISKVTSESDLYIAGYPAEKANPAFEPNDRIVGIDDKPVADVLEMKRILAEKFDQPITYLVERDTESGTQQIEITVGANPRREYGLVMKWSGITAIQLDSPAAKSGLKVGDQIVAIDGQDPGDLFSLDQRMTALARNKDATVGLTVLRDGESLEFEVAPRLPEFLASIDINQPIAINSLGIAIRPTNVVKNSAIAGIETGDEISRIEFLFENEDQKKLYYKMFKKPVIDLSDDDVGWEFVELVMEKLPPGFQFKVFKKGDESSAGIESETTLSSSSFIPVRGILLSPSEATFQVETWQEAISLGAYQTWRDGSRIFKFLGKLVKRQMSPTNLGGPGLIAVAATSGASQGTSRLLLFLTLLSANLAIVNFLPIPVLDGGHMLFLAYEGLFRQPPNEKIQIVLTYAGLFLILGLMLYVILLDFNRFSGWF